jgi:Hemerythrin HHE cation binding domain
MPNASTSRKPKRAPRPSAAARRIRRDAGIGAAKNAIALLKADHREVERLFKEFKKAETATRKRQLAQSICTALKIHMAIEEGIFYPACLAATNATETHNEALVEHDGAKKLIAEIESSGPSHPLFAARVTVLAEMIKHHVKEEERFGGMFTKARWSRMDLDALGARMQMRKDELMTSPAKRALGRARVNRAAVIRAAAMDGSKRAAREGAGGAH